MTNIRRYTAGNWPVFITAVCYGRKQLLRYDAEKESLLEIIKEVKFERTFRMLGYVILDDHYHWIIRADALDISSIMQSVKSTGDAPTKCWQRRFWDHIIRDQADLNRHLDYIHYNPVKHGYVGNPAEYAYSSFRAYVARGSYAENWGMHSAPGELSQLELE